MGVKSILQMRLEVVKKRKELLIIEEARLLRMVKQKRMDARKLAKVRKEKLALMAEEAKLLRVARQSA